MYNIDYYRGRADAAKEAHELLQLIHSHDPEVVEQMSILSKHLLDMAERADHYIDMELSIMEGDDLLRR